MIFCMLTVFNVSLPCVAYICSHALPLNEHRLILLRPRPKPRCLLLSHWVGQWIKPLYISTAAHCLSSACSHVGLNLLLSYMSIQRIFWKWIQSVSECCDFSLEPEAFSRNGCLNIVIVFVTNFPPSRHHWTTEVRCPSQILDLSQVERRISSSLQTKMESSPRLHLWVWYKINKRRCFFS